MVDILLAEKGGKWGKDSLILTYETSRLRIELRDNSFDPRKFRNFISAIEKDIDTHYDFGGETYNVLLFRDGDFCIKAISQCLRTGSGNDFFVTLPYSSTYKKLTKILDFQEDVDPSMPPLPAPIPILPTSPDIGPPPDTNCEIPMVR